MAIQPPEIDAFPPPPQRGNKDTFADLFDAVITWFSISVSKVGQACLSAYQNAVAAALSASTAEAAAEAATFASSAVQWVSGTTYTKGKVVWSAANGRTYRRLIAGAGTTDPASDRVNWVILSSEPDLLATAIVSTTVANIDFLNIFNADYDKYTVELSNLTGSSSLRMRLAFGGVVDSSGIYRIMGGHDAILSSATELVLIGNISTAGVSGTIDVRGVNLGGKAVGYRGFSNDNSGVIAIIKEGVANRTGAASGFQLFGNVTTATVRIFGHRNS